MLIRTISSICQRRARATAQQLLQPVAPTQRNWRWKAIAMQCRIIYNAPARSVCLLQSPAMATATWSLETRRHGVVSDASSGRETQQPPTQTTDAVSQSGYSGRRVVIVATAVIARSISLSTFRVRRRGVAFVAGGRRQFRNRQTGMSTESRYTVLNG
jgi:hypothetical protein